MAKTPNIISCGHGLGTGGCKALEQLELCSVDVHHTATLLLALLWAHPWVMLSWGFLISWRDLGTHLVVLRHL